ELELEGWAKTAARSAAGVRRPARGRGPGAFDVELRRVVTSGRRRRFFRFAFGFFFFFRFAGFRDRADFGRRFVVGVVFDPAVAADDDFFAGHDALEVGVAGEGDRGFRPVDDKFVGRAGVAAEADFRFAEEVEGGEDRFVGRRDAAVAAQRELRRPRRKTAILRRVEEEPHGGGRPHYQLRVAAEADRADPVVAAADGQRFAAAEADRALVRFAAAPRLGRAPFSGVGIRLAAGRFFDGAGLRALDQPVVGVVGRDVAGDEAADRRQRLVAFGF